MFRSTILCLSALVTTLLAGAASLPVRGWVKTQTCDALMDDFAVVQCRDLTRKLDRAADSLDKLQQVLPPHGLPEKVIDSIRIFRHIAPHYNWCPSQQPLSSAFLLRFDRDLAHMRLFLRLVRKEGALETPEVEAMAERRLAKVQTAARNLWRLLMWRHSSFPTRKPVDRRDVLHHMWLPNGSQRLRRIRYFLGCRQMAQRLRRIAVMFREEQDIFLPEK